MSKQNNLCLFYCCLFLILLSVLFRFEKQEEKTESAVQIFVKNLSEKPLHSNIITDTTIDSKILLSSRMEYFFDVENQYPAGPDSTGKEALLFDQCFEPAEGKTNWGVHTEVCWFRASITSSLDRDIVFYASNLVDHVPFTLDKGQSVYLYYRLEYDDAGIVCTPSISSTELFNRNVTNRTIYSSVLLGIYIGLFLYNLFLAFSTKEKPYPSYLAGLFFFSMYLLFREFSVSIGAWDIASASFTLPAYLCMSNVYTGFLSPLRKKAKGLLYGFYILLLFGIISLYIGVCSPSLGSIFKYVFSVFLFSFAVWISLSNFKEKKKTTFFFLLSWLPALFGLALSILSSLQLYTFKEGSFVSFLGSNPGMYLQIAFQMIALSFVLGDQINREKEKAIIAGNISDELKMKDSMQKDFILYISHEIRTILSLVSGGLEGLRTEKFGRIEKSVDDCLVSLQCNEKQLEEYISNLLLFTKINMQKKSLNKTPQNITSTLYLLACSFTSLAQARNITYQNLIDKNESFIIENNIHLFELMINNLLSNAFKFTKKEGEIIVSMYAADNFCKISISNTGDCIPKDKQKTIFSKFARLSTETQGTGLGLHMVQQCAALLGGSVEVESKDGLTCFSVSLPLITDEVQPLSLKTIHSIKTTVPDTGKTENILLVEDNEDLLAMIASNLKMEFTVTTAKDGLEALELLQKEYTPDLIISDILMPRMDGITFFKTLRLDDEKHIPFIFLSAVDNELDKEALFNLGAVDFINKPFNLTLLTVKVKNLLGWKSQELVTQKKDLQSAIMAVFNGQNNPGLTPEQALESKIKQCQFSKQEEAVLREVLKGFQDKEIGVTLHLATSTVSNYLQKIYRKTKTNGRTSLMLLFSGSGLRE